MRTESFYDILLGPNPSEKLRFVCVRGAIFGFLLHLLLCILYQFGFVELSEQSSDFFDSYLDSLYTPFSIFLAYEVYELIRTIPESFTNSIGKQFEIITLLVVRDILKRLSDIDASTTSAIDDSITILAVESIAFLVLFCTALLFKRAGGKQVQSYFDNDKLDNFILQKKGLAILLFAVYILVAVYSLSSWTLDVLDGEGTTNRTIFFLDFFTILIMADILILLISYQYITDFSHLARNTGFILSTVILRVAIASPGVSGAIMFILAGGLGIAVLWLSILLNKKATYEFFEME